MATVCSENVAAHVASSNILPSNVSNTVLYTNTLLDLHFTAVTLSSCALLPHRAPSVAVPPAVTAVTLNATLLIVALYFAIFLYHILAVLVAVWWHHRLSNDSYKCSMAFPTPGFLHISIFNK